MKAMGQCLHFGKSVQDNGYGMFREMLDYKLAWKGKKMVKVDRFFPSSKKCCKCGRIKKELKLSERVYHCACGNKMDRDVMQQSIYVKKQKDVGSINCPYPDKLIIRNMPVSG